MSRLSARCLVGDKAHYSNRSIFLPPDTSLAPFTDLDKMISEVVHLTHRAPHGKLCNLPVGSLVSDVSGVWVHSGTSELTIPTQFFKHDPIPPPPTAADIQHAESSPSSAIAHAGGVLAHPSVVRTLQAFRTRFSQGFTGMVKLPAPGVPPIINRATKRPRTPFPVNKSDAHRNGDARSSPSKRSRTTVGLPPVEARPSFSATLPAVSRKVQVQGGQTNLHQLVQWLTSYMHFLISNPDRASRATSLVDFSGQEAAMCKMMDIFVHYHPDNAIIFLALWYLDRLFPKALVMSRGLVEQDGVELMSRMFLLGLTLANKWLNDFKMPLKDWSLFCSLPLSSIYQLELSALAILDHNISISNVDWVSWLSDIGKSTSCYPPPYDDKRPVAAVVDGLLTAAPMVSGRYLNSRPKPIARPVSFKLSSIFYSQLMRGLYAISKQPDPMPLRAICKPAPWNPENDPIVVPCAHGRITGAAPGALPPATTALDLLVSILTNDNIPDSCSNALLPPLHNSCGI